MIKIGIVENLDDDIELCKSLGLFDTLHFRASQNANNVSFAVIKRSNLKH